MKRIIFWFFVVMSVAVTFWWSLYVPYHPERLYRVIPVHASVVSAHYNIGGRWDDFAANPVTCSLLVSAGLAPKDLDALSRDKAFRTWLKNLASDDVVIAYVPSSGPTRPESWVFASWIGGKSQRLRWTTSVTKIPGLEKIAHLGGRDIWQLEGNAFTSGEKLTLTLVEGMLLGCISKGDAMSTMLESYDGRYPSLTIRKDFLPDAATRECLDRGWFKVRPMPQHGLLTSTRLRYQFAEIGSNRLSGKIGIPWKGSVPGALRATKNSTLSRIADLSVIHFSFDSSLLASVFKTNTWRGLIPGQGPMTIGLLTDELSGRFKGFKLPTLWVGAEVADETQALQNVSAMMDRLNGQYQWGLVSQSVQAGPGQVYAVESTADNFYSSVALEERVTYSTLNDALFFSSNLSGLTNLITKIDRDEKWPSKSDHASSLVSGSIDLEHGGKALRLIVTAYSMKLAMEDPLGSQPKRQKLNEAKAWIDAMAPLKTLQFALKPATNGVELVFETRGD